MKTRHPDTEIISAPSILGLRPDGVEDLPKSLLGAGLATSLKTRHPIVQVPTLNPRYDARRDPETQCLNPATLREFSLHLGPVVAASIRKGRFPLVLGGDCSILLGIMPALKKEGRYGLIFLDAHADFYEPEQSTTGEVADMDLGIVTGHGPSVLSDIDGQRPYVEEALVVHIGQRDQEETARYGSADILDTAVKCFDLAAIRQRGLRAIQEDTIAYMQELSAKAFWLHFDTDVLSDEANPAVNYRLPGGLSFDEASMLIGGLLRTGRIAGISVTVFNPRLDADGRVARGIVQCLEGAFGRR